MAEQFFLKGTALLAFLVLTFKGLTSQEDEHDAEA